MCRQLAKSAACLPKVPPARQKWRQLAKSAACLPKVPPARQMQCLYPNEPPVHQ